MDISGCSAASSNASSHGYNLRKRSIPNYFPSPSSTKRAKNVGSALAVATNTVSSSATTTTRPPATRKERKTADVKKIKSFHINEDLFDMKEYGRRCGAIAHHNKTMATKKRKSDVHIHQLPTCVMSHIFKLLSPLNRVKAERVCRRWNFVARNFSWNATLALTAASVSPEVNFTVIEPQQYSFCDAQTRVVGGRINTIVNRAGKYLEKVDFSAFPFLDYKVCNLLRFTPRVERIDLSGIFLTNSSLSTIGGNLPRLKYAKFRRCFHRTQVERGMSRFLSACRQLETLDVSENEYFAGEVCFADLPPSILHLLISRNYRVGDAAMAGIQRNCHRLKSLIMDRVDLVSAGALNALFDHLPELENLQYGNCSNNALRTNEVLSIGKLKNLKQLTLYNNVVVTEGLLKAVGHNCLKLEQLDVSCNPNHPISISDHGLRYLANLPKLSVVNLSGIRSLTDHTLCDIAAKGQLKELLLHRCYKITNDSITYVLKSCKQLRILDVSYCAAVTDVSVKQLVQFLDAIHGKTYPRAYCPDTEKFCLWAKRSGITLPLKKFAHPWLKVMNELDYDYMVVGHLINWTNLALAQFPWIIDNV